MILVSIDDRISLGELCIILCLNFKEKHSDIFKRCASVVYAYVCMYVKNVFTYVYV